MASTWCVTFHTTEKNFRRKTDALRFLRDLTVDVRIRPVCVRHCPGAYTFYGPGRDERVLRANIDRLSFSSLKRRG